MIEIEFRLDWVKPGKSPARAFKLESAYQLAAEYAGRIRKFAPCQIMGRSTPAGKTRGTKVWICQRDGRMLSSIQLAGALGGVLDGAARRLTVLVGGPDGFDKGALREWEPDLVWSFGPLTLPHELAAAVACEQVYRGWTILRRLPYHTGH